MVEKGVHERVRLTKIYEKRREELERQHEEVRLSLEEKKVKVCYRTSSYSIVFIYNGE
jgi:phosphatidylinositol phospholipase C beta